jgi:hypothetical protein
MGEWPPDIRCDTCRQHRAVEHFIDAGHASGVPTQRHLCIVCFGFHPITDWHLVELHQYILTSGKCEQCGAPAFAVYGIPGPRCHVYCETCADGWLIHTKS